jgi:hypothetical protein
MKKIDDWNKPMLIIKNIELDKFTVGYLEAALWTETVQLPYELVNDYMDIDIDHPLYGVTEDKAFDKYFDIYDFTVEALRMAVHDCSDFQENNWDDLSDENDENAGRDFWLTRNKHGAGFWNGNYEENKSKRLTDDAHAYGPLTIDINSDGTLDFA